MIVDRLAAASRFVALACLSREVIKPLTLRLLCALSLDSMRRARDRARAPSPNSRRRELGKPWRSWRAAPVVCEMPGSAVLESAGNNSGFSISREMLAGMSG